jgi:hypothetical protein
MQRRLGYENYAWIYFNLLEKVHLHLEELKSRRPW